MFDSVGNLYGTASGGGTYGYGVVFELSPVGTSWTETVLHSFDGANPVSGLIMDKAGNLYGTTLDPNASDGTVFELSLSGGVWTEQVIYSFDIATGHFATAGLTMDAAGNIFGATGLKAFELSPNGDGGWNGVVIHNFPDSPKDGELAFGALVLDNAGNLYGTTEIGGAKSFGTVYRLSPQKNGKWTETILHSFKGGKKDGSEPFAGIVFDAAGNIYGSTIYGGASDAGTVYELVAPVGKGSYKEKVVWNFNGTDGSAPSGGLILGDRGNLYGTTVLGGSSGTGCGDGCGVVFEVNPSAAATTTTLTSSPNPSTNGEAVAFTALVTSSSGAPPDGETVTFEHGTTVLGMGALSSGSASFVTSSLPLGTTTVKAVYGGDFYFLGGTSNTAKQVVEK